MVLTNGQMRVMFTARDYEASIAFYREGLGLPVDHSWDYSPTDRGTVFHAAGGMIEIFAPAPDADYIKPEGISILIQVEDADRFYRSARDKNLKILQEPTNYPWGHRVLRITDPDGLVISLFTLIEG